MNYVKPINGKWYQLHNREDGVGSIYKEEPYFIYYNGSFKNVPYIYSNDFMTNGGFLLTGGDYRCTEASIEDINPYVPEKYKIKQNYEIY